VWCWLAASTTDQRVVAKESPAVTGAGAAVVIKK